MKSHLTTVADYEENMPNISYHCKDRFFDKKATVRDLILHYANLSSDKSQKEDSYVMENGMLVVPMNNLPLKKAEEIANIFNEKFVNLNAEARAAGKLMDTSFKILHETCQLCFNAEVFKKDVLPILNAKIPEATAAPAPKMSRM